MLVLAAFVGFTAAVLWLDRYHLLFKVISYYFIMSLIISFFS